MSRTSAVSRGLSTPWRSSSRRPSKHLRRTHGSALPLARELSGALAERSASTNPSMSPASTAWSWCTVSFTRGRSPVLGKL